MSKVIITSTHPGKEIDSSHIFKVIITSVDLGKETASSHIFKVIIKSVDLQIALRRG